MMICFGYDKHPDFEDAKEILYNPETGQEVIPESLIGKHISNVRVEKGTIFLILD